MLSEALPLTSVTVPSTVAPSLNVTVPVGTPAPEVTVELSVTVCPTVEGFGVEVKLVDVAAAAGALATGVTVGEVLAANAPHPVEGGGRGGERPVGEEGTCRGPP